MGDILDKSPLSTDFALRFILFDKKLLSNISRFIINKFNEK